MKKVIFVLGIGRSGSTLLDYMLGSHPRCFDLNEISKLPEIHRHRERESTQIFWNKEGKYWEQKFTPEELDRLVAGLSNHRLNPLIPLKVERFFRQLFGADYILNPYSQIFDKIDADVLVDSSKYVDWVSKKLNAREFRAGSLQGYLIHLVRDGRAVLNSYSRVYKDLTVEQFSRRWSTLMRQDEQFFEKFPAERKLLVRYEALASDPEATLTQICNMVGLSYDPEMIEYWKHEHYGIVGNFGTRSIIDKYKGNQTEEKVQDVHGSYYEKQGITIRLDLRWKNELPQEKIDEFYRLVGDMNKPYEWDETTEKQVSARAF
ncbi:MAG: sulfotransferase [Microcoleaceae cyanobacterium]